MSAAKTERVANLDAKHTASLNVLSSTPQTAETHAASLGITAWKPRNVAVRQRGVVVEKEGERLQGSTLDSYTTTSL